MSEVSNQSAVAATSISQLEPFRVGIAAVGEELNSPALKLFILGMNRIQRHFEYEFLTDDIPDLLLLALTKTGELDREDVREIARDFPTRFGRELTNAVKAYSIKDERLPDYFVVVSMAKFRDGYFNLRVGQTSVVALGNWKNSMAPPSIIEFIQTLVVREAIAGICPTLEGSQHFGTKACICDFSRQLSDVRLKVITGFVCNSCRSTLDAAGYGELGAEIELALSKDWIGDLNSSASLASSIEKFGVNLFVAKGLTPTWKERIVNAIREDGFKELIKFLYAIVLAGLVFYLGWKAG